MNIRCENCGAEHELDPPAWVLSSGRPFRFRCSVCGHSQMAEPPTALALPDGASDVPPEPRSMTPAAGSDGDATPVRATAPREAAPAGGEAASEADSVFLKQDGKVYLVKDWATLQRWIMERRVGREDLVSEGGVRWEPIGSRPELGSFFAAVEQLEAAELAGLHGGDTPFPTEESGWEASEPERPPPSGLARLDDETEGVPLGLPPLPTEDLDPRSGAPAEDEAYPEQPPSRLSAASPPESELLDPPSVDAPGEAGSFEDPTPSMPIFDDAALVEAPAAPPEPEADLDMGFLGGAVPPVEPAPPVAAEAPADPEDDAPLPAPPADDHEPDEAPDEAPPVDEPAAGWDDDEAALESAFFGEDPEAMAAPAEAADDEALALDGPSEPSWEGPSRASAS